MNNEEREMKARTKEFHSFASKNEINKNEHPNNEINKIEHSNNERKKK